MRVDRFLQAARPVLFPGYKNVKRKSCDKERIVRGVEHITDRDKCGD